jgi:hypothetical protein
MCNAVRELKTRAEILHHRVSSGDEDALLRIRVLPELSKLTGEALSAAVSEVRRKHCLTVVAREHGFVSWEQARRVLEGTEDEVDRGTLLYPAQGGALNVWFSTYEEARAHLDETRGRGEQTYLLPYRRQFLVAEGLFIEAIGLDPTDADWEKLRFDLTRPVDLDAYRRLYKKRVDAMRGAT